MNATLFGRIQGARDSVFGMSDRSVLITGGTGGLGSAVTAAFIAAGWRVVLPTIDGTTHVDGADVLPDVDLTDEASVASALRAAAGQPAAPLRAVVNLVGGYAGGVNVHEMPVADFERQFALNLRPTFLVTQAALPHLVDAGGGSIVCVGTRAAVQPFPGASGYIASKAAVIAFAQAVAVEYRDAGVRCNVVLPSIIDTPGNRAAQPGADVSRWVDPAHIASTIRFLASDESAATSGAAIPVYGRA
jgi:NAD(P)-dependent dehydrogenase (short-subunit alcohol dehydrogenase family)